MASLKDIRIRIDSTKNTQQITKAMKLVSAAKLRKAQHQIVNMRPYATTLLHMISDIAVTYRVSHPLIAHHAETKKVLLVVLSSDRGLCGAFNSNINKFTDAYIRENKGNFETLDFIFIGKRAIDFFARKKISPKQAITRLDKDVSYEMASKIADQLMNSYLDGQYDEIRLIYNEFKSAISQKVVSERLLPVELSQHTFQSDHSNTFAVDMIFEPQPEKIIDDLLVRHFSVQVYRAMCESVAAEHGARMSAMENATNNAKEVLNKLTLTYNKLRQEKITTELTEIVSGAEAV